MKKSIILYISCISYIFGVLPDIIDEISRPKQQIATGWSESLDLQFTREVPYIYSEEDQHYILIKDNNEVLHNIYLKIQDSLQNIHQAYKNRLEQGLVLLFKGKKNLYSEFQDLVVSFDKEVDPILKMDKTLILRLFRQLNNNARNVNIYKFQLSNLKAKLKNLDGLINYTRLSEYQLPDRSKDKQQLEALYKYQMNIKSNPDSKIKKPKKDITARSRYKNIMNVKRMIQSQSQFMVTIVTLDDNMIREKVEDSQNLITYAVNYFNSKSPYVIREMMSFLQGLDNMTYRVFTVEHPDWSKFMERISYFNIKIISGNFQQIESESFENQKLNFHNKAMFIEMLLEILRFTFSIYERHFPELIKLDGKNSIIDDNELKKLLKKGDDQLKEEGIQNIDSILKLKLQDSIDYENLMKVDNTNEKSYEFKRVKVIKRGRVIKQQKRYNTIEGLEAPDELDELDELKKSMKNLLSIFDNSTLVY